MVYFQTKIPKMGMFLRALDWKMFIYFRVIWNILLAWKVFAHLVHFVLIWYNFPVLVSRTKKNLATLYPAEDHVVAA
jgi:hypothetical protein